jgi:4-amino-4-deoxy-L-arabinose transferase-like glycosyltransferase
MAQAVAGEGDRRQGLEWLLALLAAVAFCANLGGVEIWGKREQRASAEAVDTVDHDHWLVAQIQGHPRLEKPPLPRWTIAALMRLTGHRNEWVVRLPSALAALGTVGLIYGLGRRLGGRAVGLTSGFVLASLVFFISEMRQGGNDGLLTFFTTLACYGAWRRLHGNDTAGAPGPRGWSLLMYLALGLGFLTKGPIVVAVVAIAVIPYIAASGQLRTGLALLADGWGAVLFLTLALSWPVPVWLRDPNAARVWYLEMGQKVFSAGVERHRAHTVLAASWPWLTAPWVALATLAAALPFLPAGRALRPVVWFPWSWAIGSLLMMSTWSVAKPSYYLPCLPGAALLAGWEWVRVTRVARAPAGETGGTWARAVLWFHWAALFVGAAAAPIVGWAVVPEYGAWIACFAAVLALSAGASAWAWRRGADAGAFAPLAAAVSAAALIAYGAIAPGLNARYSHRALAEALERLVPASSPTIMFFDEADEGLWFYLRNRRLDAVPGSQPRYNMADDLYLELHERGAPIEPEARVRQKAEILRAWLDRPDRTSSYLLMRQKRFEQLAPSFDGRLALVYREEGLGRYEMVLLRVLEPAPRTAEEPARASTKR